MPAYEERFPFPKPYYVGGGFGEGVEDIIQEVQDAGGNVRNRVRAWQAEIPATTAWTLFSDAFNATFKFRPRFSRSLYYEFSYLAAYAIAAADGPLTGTSVAAGLRKITRPGGQSLVLGPGNGGSINQALERLASGGVTFTGPSGEVVFREDLSRDPKNFRFHSVCFLNDAGTIKNSPTGAGDQRLDITNLVATGTYTCP
jgi:hypothetical protein